MSDKREAVETALADVKSVAKILHVPLDLSTLEKAIADAFGESQKDEPKEEKGEEKSETPAKPEPTPAQPAQRAPVGVNLNR